MAHELTEAREVLQAFRDSLKKGALGLERMQFKRLGRSQFERWRESTAEAMYRGISACEMIDAAVAKLIEQIERDG